MKKLHELLDHFHATPDPKALDLEFKTEAANRIHALEDRMDALEDRMDRLQKFVHTASSVSRVNLLEDEQEQVSQTQPDPVLAEKE